MKFQLSHGQLGQIVAAANSATRTVPCFPLETLLLALRWTTVDFFSLDVEGVEIDVFNSIDFNRTRIRTLAVEVEHAAIGEAGYMNYFSKEKGFSFVKKVHFADTRIAFYANDMLFTKF